MAELCEILKAIDDGALEEWTNARTLARGRGCCDRVGELGFVHGVLTAKNGCFLGIRTRPQMPVDVKVSFP